MKEAGELEVCPCCGYPIKIKTRIVEHKFEYGDEILVKNPPVLTAIIPVQSCHECGINWYGEIASMIIDYVTKKHLESLKG